MLESLQSSLRKLRPDTAGVMTNNLKLLLLFDYWVALSI